MRIKAFHDWNAAKNSDNKDELFLKIRWTEVKNDNNDKLKYFINARLPAKPSTPFKNIFSFFFSFWENVTWQFVFVVGRQSYDDVCRQQFKSATSRKAKRWRMRERRESDGTHEKNCRVLWSVVWAAKHFQQCTIQEAGSWVNYNLVEMLWVKAINK